MVTDLGGWLLLPHFPLPFSTLSSSNFRNFGQALSAILDFFTERTISKHAQWKLLSIFPTSSQRIYRKREQQSTHTHHRAPSCWSRVAPPRCARRLNIFSLLAPTVAGDDVGHCPINNNPSLSKTTPPLHGTPSPKLGIQQSPPRLQLQLPFAFPILQHTFLAAILRATPRGQFLRF